MISLFLTCTAVLFLQTRIAVWNDKNLPADAIPVIRSWPGTPQIVTNKMCDLLAKRYSCRAYFRVDILAIMKADACRYMALYNFGGEYADLDVQFLKPLKNCTGLCVGHEYQPFDKRRDFANYFMAVDSANNPCLKKAVTLCCNRLASVVIDFNSDPHLVHNSCGPSAFTESIRSCASVMSHAQLKSHVAHHVASVNWKQNYPSWVKERKAIAGWSSVYQH